MSFKDMLKIAKETAKNKQKEDTKKRVEYNKQGILYCPRCLSTSISDNKKGFGLAKGVAGAIIAGPAGMIAGGIGKNKIECTCLKCGYKFKPGSKI